MKSSKPSQKSEMEQTTSAMPQDTQMVETQSNMDTEMSHN